MSWREPFRRLPGSRKAVLEWKSLLGRLGKYRKPADLSVFHDFAPPPTGGGHQFMRALIDEFMTRGVRIELNAIHPESRALFFNSYNFQTDLLRRLKDRPIHTVHRVDGPLLTYRGFDDGTDRLISQINHELANVSIFQSHFSKNEHHRLKLSLRDGPVIGNAADPNIFQKRGDHLPTDRLRIISTSWSDNPNKGLDVYEWLDRNLNFKEFDYIFVGKCRTQFKNIRHIPPCTTEEVAKHLHNSDLFITASVNDPCSNSLIEALTIGLPCIYRESGGHPELVGEAGEGFSNPEEIPELIGKIRNHWEDYRRKIKVKPLSEVADNYLQVMGLAEFCRQPLAQTAS